VAGTSYSVVTPPRNAAATLPRVLESLAAQKPARAEVVVVDDGSEDGPAELAAERCARVVSTRDGRSAGGARNEGWAAATGEVVVFLEADAVPTPGWGAGVARGLEEFQSALVGCARTFDADTPWGRRQQRRLAYGLARATPLEESRARRALRRVPLHYFALLRLPVIFRRVAPDRRLRDRFVVLLPRLVVAEWSLGASALHYALRRPALRGESQPQFE
jgi:glycosyltransferase involved in cell wall biosynthesis